MVIFQPIMVTSRSNYCRRGAGDGRKLSAVWTTAFRWHNFPPRVPNADPGYILISMEQKKTQVPIKNEADNGLKIVHPSMARTQQSRLPPSSHQCCDNEFLIMAPAISVSLAVVEGMDVYRSRQNWQPRYASERACGCGGDS
jgi:hypothetical protein